MEGIRKRTLNGREASTEKGRQEEFEEGRLWRKRVVGEFGFN